MTIAEKLGEIGPPGASRAPRSLFKTFWNILGKKQRNKQKQISGQPDRAQGPGPRARDQWTGPKGGPMDRAQGRPNGQDPMGDQWTGPKGGPMDRAQGGPNGQGPMGDQWTGPTGPGTRAQGPGLGPGPAPRGPQGHQGSPQGPQGRSYRHGAPRAPPKNNDCLHCWSKQMQKIS